ncbi:DUF2092 domain-containing protein [Kitasatospora sp. NPDC048540]|uniref:LolA family protein n=1 Tax=unclassified Kitasatospora TaxID=2633591 RepID=UPI0005399A0F|nr:hypothetical protein [Kitasatospora sp. MBT63]
MVDQDTPYRTRRRTVGRVLVPVAVGAVVAAGAGLVPALASDSAPNLPAVSAEQLVAKVLGSETDAFSGTVKVKADLGVPSQLLGAAGGGGASPQAKALELLGGEHTLQVAADGPDRQRLGLVGELGGYEVVHNGDQLWAWDSKANEAHHVVLPKDAGHGRAAGAPLGAGSLTPQELAKQVLAAGAGTTSVTVDGTVEVAGRAAYKLSVKPTQAGSTVREVRIAVDAEHGVPLGVLVQVAGGGSPVLDAHFSSVSFATPAAKTFEFSAPKGAKVTEGRDAAAGAPAGAAEAAEAAGAARGKAEPARPGGDPGVNVVGEGWTAVLSTRLPEGGPSAGAGQDARGHGKGGPDNPLALVKSLGKPVGGGSLISTRLLNVLVTDDGRVFAGAVTLPVLQSAAGVK